MTVSKKNLCVRNIKVYPLDFDMAKRCFVRFYVATGVKCRICVAKKFDTIDKRKAEANRIVKDLLKNGFKLNEIKVENKANKHIELLFELLDSRKKLSLKTLAALIPKQLMSEFYAAKLHKVYNSLLYDRKKPPSVHNILRGAYPFFSLLN